MGNWVQGSPEGRVEHAMEVRNRKKHTDVLYVL